MGKNAYERRLIREAKKAAQPPPVRSIHWHERNVLKRAEHFAQVYANTVGFGAPVARAGGALHEAVERLRAARTKHPSAGCSE